MHGAPPASPTDDAPEPLKHTAAASGPLRHIGWANDTCQPMTLTGIDVRRPSRTRRPSLPPALESGRLRHIGVAEDICQPMALKCIAAQKQVASALSAAEPGPLRHIGSANDTCQPMTLTGVDVRRPSLTRRPSLPSASPQALKCTAAQQPEEEASCKDEGHGGGLGGFLALTLGATGVVFGDIGTSPLYAFTGVFVEVLEEHDPAPRDVVGAFSMIFWCLTFVVGFKYVTVVLSVSHHGEGGAFAMLHNIFDKQEAEGRAGSTALKTLVIFATIAHRRRRVHHAGGVRAGRLGGHPRAHERGRQGGLGSGDHRLHLPDPAARLRGDRQGRRPHHRRLVPRHRGHRHLQPRGAPRGGAPRRQRLQPRRDRRLLDEGRVRRRSVENARRGGALRHRRGGPLRRHGPLRARPHLRGVGRPRLPLLGAAVHGPGHGALREAPRCREPLLQRRARGPQMADGGPRDDHEGQVYIPEVNWALCIACLVICVIFKTSAKLAGAYGIAVTSTFLITTFLLAVVIRTVWRWSWLATLAIILPLSVIDAALWSSVILRIVDSGWVPVLISAVLCFMMHVNLWGHGQERAVMAKEAALETDEIEPRGGIDSPTRAVTVTGLQSVLSAGLVRRTDKVIVFLTPYELRVPRTVGALATLLGCLPQTIVLLSIRFESVPFIPEERRATLIVRSNGVFTVTLHFGYAEPLVAAKCQVHKALAGLAREQGKLFPDLAPLAELDRHLDIDESLALEGSIAGVAVAKAGDSAHRSPTFVVSKVHYARQEGAKHRWWNRLRIACYALIQLNARNSIDLLGLQGDDTIEVSVVRYV